MLELCPAIREWARAVIAQVHSVDVQFTKPSIQLVQGHGDAEVVIRADFDSSDVSTGSRDGPVLGAAQVGRLAFAAIAFSNNFCGAEIDIRPESVDI